MKSGSYESDFRCHYGVNPHKYRRQSADTNDLFHVHMYLKIGDT
jgi:hypothetical protein